MEHYKVRINKAETRRVLSILQYIEACSTVEYKILKGGL